MKIIYDLTEEEYNEAKNENWYGCESAKEWIREIIIENFDLILYADLEIKIEKNKDKEKKEKEYNKWIYDWDNNSMGAIMDH